jgi:hypothetical protein
MSYHGQIFEDPDYYEFDDDADWQDLEDADEDRLNEPA